MNGLLAAFAGLVFAVAADLVAARVGFSRPTCYAISLLTGMFASLGAVFVLSMDNLLISLAISMLAYVSWWYAFLNIVQSLESSLRVRLLGEIRSAGGRISTATLRSIYNDDVLLRLRLERLIAHGAVIERDGHLFVFSHALKGIAAVFRVLKLNLIGRSSEFETR